MAALTAQEQKILLLVAEGKTNKEIAAEVFLSDKTVKNYVSARSCPSSTSSGGRRPRRSSRSTGCDRGGA